MLQEAYLILSFSHSFIAYSFRRRSVLVMRDGLSDGPQKDLTPADHNVRTLVQEYGGESWGLFSDCVIYSNMKDQRLYMQKLAGGKPKEGLIPLKCCKYVCLTKECSQKMIFAPIDQRDSLDWSTIVGIDQIV